MTEEVPKGPLDKPINPPEKPIEPKHLIHKLLWLIVLDIVFCVIGNILIGMAYLNGSRDFNHWLLGVVMTVVGIFMIRKFK